VCGPGHPGGETLTPPGGVRRTIRRVAESPKSRTDFDDVTGTKFLMHLLYSGCTNWPRLKRGKGKKRAASVPVASVATAVYLGDEEGGANPAKRPIAAS